MHHEEGILWVKFIPGLNKLPVHFANAILIAVIIAVISLLARKNVKIETDEDVIPDDKLTFKNIVEFILEGVFFLGKDTLGEETKRFSMLLGTLTFFILFCNLSGLVPGFSPPTGNWNTTLAMALVTLVLYNYYGFKEHGAGYIRHFTGPVLPLAPLFFPLEVIGHMSRAASLSLRLFGNISGDHLVAAIIFSLIPLVTPIPFMFLGLFVSFIQTLVFVLLTIAYIQGATMHTEH